MLNRKSNQLSSLVRLGWISRFLIMAGHDDQLSCLGKNPFAKTQIREVNNFNQIVVGGLVNVQIKQGEQAGIKVSAFGIDMQDITTTVKNGTLIMTTTGNHSGESISIDVTYNTLTSVRTSGTATIETDGPINAESFSVVIFDAEDADLELNVGELNVEMRDKGNLTLNGRVKVQNFKSYGGGGQLDNSYLQIGQ